MVFLQRCALHSQGFPIFHREYIGFESPDQIRTLSSGFYITTSTYRNFKKKNNKLTSCCALVLELTVPPHRQIPAVCLHGFAAEAGSVSLR